MNFDSDHPITDAIRNAQEVEIDMTVHSIMRTDGGKPLNNLANVLTLLRTHPQLKGKFRFNSFSCSVEQRASIEGVDFMSANPYPRSLIDSDAVLVQEFIQRDLLSTIKLDVIHHALDVVARENSYNPVLTWLDSLVWDGRERLPMWLYNYLDGQEAAEYMAEVGKMFLIGMVARVYKPGCQADYTLVLEGTQGALKSTACRILGGDYFSDALPPDVSDKDAGAHLRGKWLIEIAEMHALNKSETTALKAFLTRRTEMYRPAYGRRDVHEPRQCMFIGTTNKQRYLRDETGGRRFWPLRVGKITLDHLIADRDQLFAEAVERFKAGEDWWPDPSFELNYLKPAQADRREDDAWEQPIRRYLHAAERVTICEVANKAVGIETARIGKADQNRIATVLEGLGWHRAPRGSNGERYWAPRPT
jgi:predicted P-loop ATPase